MSVYTKLTKAIGFLEIIEDKEELAVRISFRGKDYDGYLKRVRS